MRYEVKPDPIDDSQWVIWDNVEDRVFARYGTKEEPTEIISKYYAAQLAAESASE